MNGVTRFIRNKAGLGISTAVFLSVAAVYWLERARNAGWGDGLGFLDQALSGFSWSVNEAGHFLYANLNTLILRLVPAADPISLITIASMLFALLALVMVYRAAMLATGNRVASLSGMLVLAFSFTFWRHAVSIEVYSMHLAFVAAFLCCIVPGVLGEKRLPPDWVGISFGLALLVHIQTILLFPALVIWGVFSGWKTPCVLRSFVWIVLAFLVLIIPAAMEPDIAVMSVFSSPTFMPDVLAFSPHALIGGAIKSIAYLVYNFHLFLPVIVLGAVRLYRRQRRSFWLYFAVVAPVWGFAFRYTVSDNYVFFLSAYLIFALTAASGFAALIETFGSRRWCSAVVLAAAFVLSPAVYRIALFSADRTPPIRNVFSTVEYKGGAAYYLWPGMRTIPDPLVIVRKSWPGGELPPGMNPGAWKNLYAYAVLYLQLTGEFPRSAN